MENVGTVTSQFTADTRSFDVSVTKLREGYEALGRKAADAAKQIRGAGSEIDAAAKVQERQKERWRRMWQVEMQAQSQTIEKERELARVREMAALKLKIETREMERAAAAQKSLNASQEMGRKIVAALQLAGIGLGIGAVVEGLKSMFFGSMEAGVELGKLHVQTGISIQDLSVLKFAAAENAVEFETVARSGKKLAEANHETDAGKLAEGFKVLGISAADVSAKGNDMYGVMELIADKFHEMPDGVEKNVAAVKLFGKSGQEMIPILNQGSMALQEMKSNAPIFSDQDVARMKEMHEAVNNLDAAWSRTSLTISSAAAGPLTRLIDLLPQVLGIGGKGEHGNDFEAAGQKWKDWGITVEEAITRVNRAIGRFTGDPVDEIESDRMIQKRFEARRVGGGVPLSAPGAPAPPPGWELIGHPSAPARSNAHADGAGAGSSVPQETWETVPYWQTNLENRMNQLRQAVTMVTADQAEQAQLEQTAAWNQVNAVDLSKYQGLFPAAQAPPVSLAPQLTAKQSAFIDAMNDALDEWTKKTTDLGAALKSLVSDTVNSVNDAILKVLTEKDPRGAWKDAGKSIFSGVARTALTMGEGEVGKALGIPMGKLGTKGNPIYTRSADSPGAAALSSGGSSAGQAIGSVGGSVMGSLLGAGVPAAAAGQGVGSLLGAVAGFAGFMADGGLMHPGGFYLAGEDGPELLQVGATSRINNARDTSRMLSGGNGDTHHTWNIDARGSNDPAAVRPA